MQIDKILIIRFSSLGDVVLTFPVIEVLKKKFPEAQIDFLTKKIYSLLLSASPHLSEVITVETSYDTKEFRKVLKKIKEKNYDLILDLHKSFRSLLFRLLGNARRSISYNKHSILRRLFLITKTKKFPLSVLREYFKTLKILGIDEVPEPVMWLPKEIKEKVNTELKKFGIKKDDMVLTFVPGAAKKTKCWDEDSYIRLGRRAIEDMGAKILLVGSKEERELSSRIAFKIGKNTFVLAGTELLETAGYIGSSSAVVCGDSGPMHIADALHVPVIALFGPTVESFGFFPLGEKAKVIQKNLWCRPCSLHGSKQCFLGHHRCMREIGVEKVMTALKEVMKEVKR